MAKVRMDEQGVNSLRACAAALPEAVEMTKAASDTLRSAFDEKKGVLGPHTSQIEQILEQVKTAQSTGSKSTVQVQLNLILAAARLQAIIDKIIGGAGSNP